MVILKLIIYNLKETIFEFTRVENLLFLMTMQISVIH